MNFSQDVVDQFAVRRPERLLILGTVPHIHRVWWLNMMWLGTLFFAAFSCLSGVSVLAEGPGIRVACVGDSITAGARVDADRESYPARLQVLLGESYVVRNFGIGGATLIRTGSPNVWQKLDALQEFQPHVVVISLGTNDTVAGQRRNWEQIGRFDQDYLELIETLTGLESNPRLIVCTPTAMVLSTPGLSEQRISDLSERRPRLQELCRRIRKLVAEKSDPRVSLLELNPLLQERPELLTEADGVHPNAGGYQAIAEKVALEIRAAEVKPNIVLFLVDDMGWQDTSVPFHSEPTPLNRKYRTPNMEHLAASGMKFTQAYACSVCSPTRVSLMTGMNAARHRVTNWTLRKNASNDRTHPSLEFPAWNVNGLSPEAGIERTIHCQALPAYLRESGYRTIHVGKAHFGAVGTPGSDPARIGFDVNIGGHAAGGPGSFLGMQNFSAAWRNADRIWDVPGLEAYHGQDIFLTEALTLEANKAVDQAVKDRKPFFLYMSHYAVHVPFAIDSRFIKRYQESGLDPTEAMYAAMVEGMDKSLGDILANIDRHGMTDNTVVLFMSDNGGLSAHGRGGSPNTHNLPLSSGKGSAHEGGIRVPMIVSWPGVTSPGTECHEPIIIEDYFPTLLEIAGIPEKQMKSTENDGVSFVNLLKNPDSRPSDARPLYWHFPNHWGPQGPGIGPSSAIRLGDWKLIYYHTTQTCELFNLAEDLGETENQVENHPEIRERLASMLRDYLISVEAQMPKLKATGERVPYPSGDNVR